MSEATAKIKAEITSKSDNFKAGISSAAAKVAEFKNKIRDLNLNNEKIKLGIVQTTDKINKYKQKIVDTYKAVDKGKLSQEKANEAVKKYEHEITKTAIKQEQLKNKMAQTTSKIHSLQRGMASVEAATKRAKNAFVVLGGVIKAAIGPIMIIIAVITGGLAILGKFAIDAIKAWIEQDKGIRLVNQALKTQGIYTSQLSKEYQKIASDIQKVTKIGDEQTLQAMSTIQAFAGQNKITKELMLSIADFATVQKIDLVSASKLVGKAILSKTNVLARYGIQIKKGISDQEKMVEIQQKLTSMFGGSAMAVAEGSGRFEQLKNVFGDVMEQFGHVFTEGLQPLLVSLIELYSSISDFFGSDIIKNIAIATLKSLFEPLVKVVNITINAFKLLSSNQDSVKSFMISIYKFGKEVSITIDIIMDFITLIIKFILVVADGTKKIINAILRIKDSTQKNSKQAQDSIIKTLAIVITFKDVIVKIVNFIIKQIENAFNSVIYIINLFKNIWNSLVIFINITKDIIINAFKKAFEGIGIPVNFAIQWIDKLIDKINDLIASTLGAQQVLNNFNAGQIGGGAIGGALGNLFGGPLVGLLGNFFGGKAGKSVQNGINGLSKDFLANYEKIRAEINKSLGDDNSIKDPTTKNDPNKETAKNTKAIKDKLDDIYKRIAAANFLKAMVDAYKNRAALSDLLNQISNTGNNFGSNIPKPNSQPMIEPVFKLTINLPGGRVIEYTGKQKAAQNWLDDIQKRFPGLPAPVVSNP